MRIISCFWIPPIQPDYDWGKLIRNVSIAERFALSIGAVVGEIARGFISGTTVDALSQFICNSG